MNDTGKFIVLKKNMTEEELDREILDIFNWYMFKRCPYIEKYYIKCITGKNRIHLYSYMRPIILAKIFNMAISPSTSDWQLVFQPVLIKNVYVDDRIDDIWIDDIMPIQTIRNLFKRWYTNSLIAHYLDQSVLENIQVDDQGEFFKLLKEEINSSYTICGGTIDHSYSSQEVGKKLKRLFKEVDTYLYYLDRMEKNENAVRKNH